MYNENEQARFELTDLGTQSQIVEDVGSAGLVGFFQIVQTIDDEIVDADFDNHMGYNYNIVGGNTLDFLVHELQQVLLLL